MSFFRSYERQTKSAPNRRPRLPRQTRTTPCSWTPGVVGQDASVPKAVRAADGIHNCQHGAVAFANWCVKELGNKGVFTAAKPNAWTKGTWTGDRRFTALGCES
ncbi:hypothetical protein [Streptomyces cyaneofuscatus]|uniref:hypothetical protein n=1 Tax=Streptomyces cyaneofuscatus TaxID=66883 RepID=UPI00365C13E6